MTIIIVAAILSGIITSAEKVTLSKSTKPYAAKGFMFFTFNYKDGSKTITFEEIENAINGSDLTDFAAQKTIGCCRVFLFTS